jgi:hypothetical protein
MRFTTIFQILAAAALSQALIIPKDITADGVYQVTTKVDGTEVHTKIANTTSLDAVTVSALERRGNGQTWCGCGIQMDQGSCDAAVADIENQFGNGNNVNSGQSFYSIRGSVVAFVCNRSSATYNSDGSFFALVASDITNTCGRYVPGSRDEGSNQFGQVIYGYMNYQNGLDFCHDSTNSGQSSC